MAEQQISQNGQQVSLNPAENTTPPPSSGASVGDVLTGLTLGGKRLANLVPTARTALALCPKCLGKTILGFTETGYRYCDCPAAQEAAQKDAEWRAECRRRLVADLRVYNTEALAGFLAAAHIAGPAWTLATYPASDRPATRPVGMPEDLPAFGSDQEILEDMRGFARAWDGARWAVLCGGFGTGKTSKLLALVRTLDETLLRLGLGATIISVPDALERLKDSYRPNETGQGRGHSWLLDHYKTCGLLVLDDLGAERMSDWTMSELHLMLDERYRRGRPVFFTTNFGLWELEQVVPRRLVERLRERADVWQMVGPSYRDQMVNAE